MGGLAASNSFGMTGNHASAHQSSLTGIVYFFIFLNIFLLLLCCNHVSGQQSSSLSGTVYWCVCVRESVCVCVRVRVSKGGSMVKWCSKLCVCGVCEDS
jgi:hypothetical protein